MSSTSGVFKGCRALFAAAKAAAPKTSAAKTAAGKPKPLPPSRPAKPRSSSSEPRKPSRPTGILKECPVSPALHHFLGVQQTSRSDAVKKVWEYIKLHNLQNPANKKEIYCDDKLKKIFEGKDKVGFLEIGKMLSHHFVKTN
ncbi:upstream activation factor subunit spp27-like [Actinidia eriantha]|uniref:upstream activation factor subunit spp27-like n=1 Tax=Actinidia eriantha TaxID=165200 RepID=UPI002587A7F5|nr:upstream activation factor subunit spp27-like [Actinidia eriantha]